VRVNKTTAMERSMATCEFIELIAMHCVPHRRQMKTPIRFGSGFKFKTQVVCVPQAAVTSVGGADSTFQIRRGKRCLRALEKERC
jgi:hypothetical protein